VQSCLQAFFKLFFNNNANNFKNKEKAVDGETICLKMEKYSGNKSQRGKPQF